MRGGPEGGAQPGEVPTDERAVEIDDLGRGVQGARPVVGRGSGRRTPGRARLGEAQVDLDAEAAGHGEGGVVGPGIEAATERNSVGRGERVERNRERVGRPAGAWTGVPARQGCDERPLELVVEAVHVAEPARVSPGGPDGGRRAATGRCRIARADRGEAQEATGARAHEVEEGFEVAFTGAGQAIVVHGRSPPGARGRRCGSGGQPTPAGRSAPSVAVRCAAVSGSQRGQDAGVRAGSCPGDPCRSRTMEARSGPPLLRGAGLGRTAGDST